MRGVWASVVGGVPLVWAVSEAGSLVATFVAAVLVMLVATVFLVRESSRVEALEALARHQQRALEQATEETRAVERTLSGERLRLETWQQRATALQTAVDEARSSRAAFLATVSHELRTPLHAIIGFTELVADGSAGPVSELQQEYLGDARAAANHLLRLITDVLDYAKSDAGRLTFAADVVPVAPLVEEVATLLEGLAAKKGLTLVTSCEQGLSLVGDGLRVKQVLLNLVGNAVKFTPRGGRVELTARSASTRCELEVRDSGPGIAAEHTGRVFEPFQQADSSTARHHAGTGLGLALVKRWTEAMGGQVELVSAEGEGCRFTVTLPSQAPAPALLRLGSSDGPDVLVAEDDDATRVMLARVLEAQGCVVRQAANGQRALEAVMEGVPSVLVLDLMMPELDGYQLLEKLRALPRGAEVKVLVFSASTPQGDDRRRLAALGAEVLLKGSLTPGELAHRVKGLAEPMRSAA